MILKTTRKGCLFFLVKNQQVFILLSIFKEQKHPFSQQHFLPLCAAIFSFLKEKGKGFSLQSGLIRSVLFFYNYVIKKNTIRTLLIRNITIFIFQITVNELVSKNHKVQRQQQNRRLF